MQVLTRLQAPCNAVEVDGSDLIGLELFGVTYLGQIN